LVICAQMLTRKKKKLGDVMPRDKSEGPNSAVIIGPLAGIGVVETNKLPGGEVNFSFQGVLNPSYENTEC